MSVAWFLRHEVDIVAAAEGEAADPDVHERVRRSSGATLKLAGVETINLERSTDD